MNIRTAILKAADSIEQNPGLFGFGYISIPDGCGTPGCALGWIGHHLGHTTIISGVSEKMGCPLGTRSDFPGGDTDFGFYDRMEELNEDWKFSADNCAPALRLYADKYHPSAGIPDSVLAIFETGFMCKVQAE